MAQNILQRINSVMAEVDYIQKQKKSGMQYNIVSHDSVVALVRGHMQKCGIVAYMKNIQVKQDTNRTEATFDVVFASIEDPNDCIVTSTFGYGIDNQDKGPGKAMSYGFKYALLKTFMIETGDDPDNDQKVVKESGGAALDAIKAKISAQINEVSTKEALLNLAVGLKKDTPSELQPFIRDVYQKKLASFGGR